MAAKPKPRIPRFAYHGSKGKLAKHIIPLLPPSGKRFIEPFAGRGNVYFRVAQELDYEEFWLNDQYTFRFFQALQHSMDDGVGWTLPDRSKIDKGFFEFLRQKAGERIQKENPQLGTSYDRIFRPVTQPGGTKAWVVEQYPPLFVIECFLSYSGGTYKSRMKGTSEGSVSKEGFMNSVRLAYEIMQRTKPSVTYYDYKHVLLECGPGDVAYIDPPYKDASVTAYSDKTLDHGEMMQMLLNAKFKWVLSEYENEIYKPLTEKFGEPIRIKVPKAMGISRDKQPIVVECLWKNF
jgi:site-specific DNA-adenine methylase